MIYLFVNCTKVMVGNVPAQMQNTSKASEDEQQKTDRKIIK